MSIPTLAWACVSVPLLVPPVGQDAERPNAAMRSVDGADPAVIPAGTLIAALPYDGISSWAHNAQDFEPEFDVFDIFLIEDIEPQTDAALVMFRSLALPNRDPAGAEDFVVRIFENNGTGLPGEDTYTGNLVMTSIPGAGFWDGEDEFVTDFGGQCLQAGSYFIVWTVRMDFICCGQVFFRDQAGDPPIGGGLPDNAWHWNPGQGYGFGTHAPAVDRGTGRQTGVNYLLFGEPANCSNPCANPNCPADLDFDGDADADDFFLFLDYFSAGDPCADLDASGTIDSADFFAYLDLFAQGCP